MDSRRLDEFLLSLRKGLTAMQQIEPLIMSAPWALDGGEHVPGPQPCGC